MKLTTEQEELLVVLVAVEDYKTDKKYKSNELLDKIGDLGMEENGFYMDEQIDDFKALKSNNLIKFECEDWDKDEEIDDYIIYDTPGFDYLSLNYKIINSEIKPITINITKEVTISINGCIDFYFDKPNKIVIYTTHNSVKRKFKKELLKLMQK